MINRAGMDIIGPPKQMTLPTIAAHISDKDQGVRSAAMNCLVEVHAFIGEDVFKHKIIGRLGDKEDSYLRERIKRSAKGGDAPVQEEKPQGNKPGKFFIFYQNIYILALEKIL